MFYLAGYAGEMNKKERTFRVLLKVQFFRSFRRRGNEYFT